MGYIPGKDRKQYSISSLDSEILQDSPARLVDLFVNSLNMKAVGFNRSTAANTGRPGFDPRMMLSIYIYGNMEGIRSSRKLERACVVNKEFSWLMHGLTPDFRSISNFRRDNRNSFEIVFKEFNRILKGESLNCSLYSIDGSKFRASNSRDRNFTLIKLDSGMSKILSSLRKIGIKLMSSESYFHALDANDTIELSDNMKEVLPLENYIDVSGSQISQILSIARHHGLKEVERQVVELKLRYKQYQEYCEEIESGKVSQISLSDPDARLMPSNDGGFCVSHNIQTAINSENHLIESFVVSSKPEDYGMLGDVVNKLPIASDESITHITADKGYQCPDDMLNCLESGVVPHVIPTKPEASYTLETDYEASETSEQERKSSKATDIRKVLRNGEIPEVYKQFIEKIEVVEVPVTVEQSNEDDNINGEITDEQYRIEAMKGYFVKVPKKNKVYCPAGQILRDDFSGVKNRRRYSNKKACKSCPYRNLCTKSNFRRVTFKDPQTFRICEEINKKLGSPKTTLINPHIQKQQIKIKRVRFIFRPEQEKMMQRKGLSEHPFGTVKRWMNSYYYLCCGREMVTAETALMFTAYNMKRAIKMHGFEGIKQRILAFCYNLGLFFSLLVISRPKNVNHTKKLTLLTD